MVLDMDRQTRQKFYLAKALEADEEAAMTTDVSTRAGWLKLANDYREMAQFT